MSDLRSAMQSCLMTLDVPLARKIWQEQFSHLESPKSDEEMLAMLHVARTQNPMINLRFRSYSHRWLIERGLPSMLPDELKQSAERMYPRMVSSVGISVNSNSPIVHPIIPFVQSAMENAVLEVYADGKQEDIKLLKQRMEEARLMTVRKLLGKIDD